MKLRLRHGFYVLLGLVMIYAGSPGVGAVYLLLPIVELVPGEAHRRVSVPIKAAVGVVLVSAGIVPATPGWPESLAPSGEWLPLSLLCTWGIGAKFLAWTVDGKAWWAKPLTLGLVGLAGLGILMWRYGSILWVILYVVFIWVVVAQAYHGHVHGPQSDDGQPNGDDPAYRLPPFGR